MESAYKILMSQKSNLEQLNSEMTSGVGEVVELVVHYSTRVTNFSSSTPPSSWYESLEFITQFIQHVCTMNQMKYLVDAEKGCGEVQLAQMNDSLVSSEATTPKARGRATTKSSPNVTPQYSGMVNDLKNAKAMIKSVLASPHLNPLKKCDTQQNKINDDDIEHLVYHLQAAGKQLEFLSKMVETFQEDQAQYQVREARSKLCVAKLEQEIQVLTTNNTSLLADLSESKKRGQFKEMDKMKKISATMIGNFHQRKHRAALEYALQSWCTQVRLLKYLNLVKEMAQELTKTREKVLLLKSHLVSN